MNSNSLKKVKIKNNITKIIDSGKAIWKVDDEYLDFKDARIVRPGVFFEVDLTPLLPLEFGDKFFWEFDLSLEEDNVLSNVFFDFRCKNNYPLPYDVKNPTKKHYVCTFEVDANLDYYVTFDDFFDEEKNKYVSRKRTEFEILVKFLNSNDLGNKRFYIFNEKIRKEKGAK